MSVDPKILIIGAGPAGIAAAARLMEKGMKNVTILEAKNRIGGRIHTVDFSENVVELGAQWCHGEDNNIIFNLASPHSLLESSKNINDSSKHIFINSIGEVLSQDETIELKRIYYKIVDEADEFNFKPGTSYGEYFNKQFYSEIKDNPLITKEKIDQILDWLHKYHNSIECSDTLYNVSANRLKDYWICKGDPLLNWKTNGYSKVFDLLTKNFPDPSKRLPVYENILFNKEVSEIDYSSNNYIIVKTTNGSTFKASNVIFTPSLGVLKEQYLKLFIPPLPESKIKAIKGLNIGVANKLFLEFPHRWWPKDTGCLSLMWSKEQKEDFYRKYGKDKYWLTDLFMFFTVDCQTKLLCGWLVGPSARHSEVLTDEILLDESYFLLKKFFGHLYDIPKPQKILRSKWYSDHHTRGSYTYRSLETEKLGIKYEDLVEPLKNKNNKLAILFAGEATHEHYYSTVHGAVETGFREADRLVDYYKFLKSRL